MGGGGLCGARDGAASLRGSGPPAPIRDLGAQRRWRASRPRASLASCWPWASRPSHLSLPVIGGWGTGDGCALDPPTRWPAGAQDPGAFRSSRAADRRTHGRPPGLTRLLSGSMRSAPTSSPSSAWRSLCPSPPGFPAHVAWGQVEPGTLCSPHLLPAGGFPSHCPQYLQAVRTQTSSALPLPSELRTAAARFCP